MLLNPIALPHLFFPKLLFLLLLLLLGLLSGSSLAACTLSITFNGIPRNYSTCVTLTDWAHLSWTFDPSASTLDTMFRALLPSSSGWVGWGINPGASPAMVGSSVILGLRDAASNSILIQHYKLTSSTMGGTPPSPGSSELNLVGSSLVDITGTVVTLFAKVSLPTNQSTGSINLVFSRGPVATSGTSSSLVPLRHSTDRSFLRSTATTINLSTSRRLEARVPHEKLRNQHGALNAVGWGIFLPLGVMVARYLRPYRESEWFYIHAAMQTIGYLLGAVGWGLGLKLGSYTPESSASQVHQNLGTSIFIFATLQVVALVFRPDIDHKIRFYWNIYHHGLGYLTLILIFTNIYKGFKLLQPSQTVQNLYTAFLVIVVIASASLEAFSWYMFAEEKKKKKESRVPTYALESPSSDSKV